MMVDRAISASLSIVAAMFVIGADVPSSYRLSPQQAVMNAAESPSGVSGVFEFAVRSGGEDYHGFYLNSEHDYRDPRNLTVALTPAVNQALLRRFGSAPTTYLLGHTIAVRGTARKTRIDFIADGCPTGKYYYQTHLRLTRPDDLTVDGERPHA
ncbi:hypothetical protein [Sphingomonas citricola]|uniref:hypothetical protein n=1 Tax=Sphingomonas citricola TaxID=2862498 RepID=UPI0021563D27|nr:hypothetical protein [Sphingomonas citricola]